MGAVIAGKLFLALAGLGVGANTATFLAWTITRLGTAILFAVASRALAPKPKQEDLARELQFPDGLPQWRFVYGDTEAPGTPAPANVVKDGILYGCWIVNSRPSAGPFTLWLDGREVELTGNAYDFTEGGGAAATNAPFAGYLKCWIGLGDQTSPPFDVTDEVPWSSGTAEHWFKTTDAWTGRTVVWLRLDRGPNASRQERWPSTPPAVALRGRFSLLFDPREVGHDIDDPDTWEWSENQALAVLDALTQNPVAPHGPDNVMLDTFEWAADVADEAVALKAGGTEPRYRIGGFLTFSDSEIEDQIEPLLAAGGAQPIRVAGRLGIVPATWQTPVYTLTDLIGPQYEFTALRAGADRYSAVRTTYTSADRDYETSDLGLWPIPGASGATRVFDQQLPLVQSAPQAQRLRKIAGLRLAQARGLAGVGPVDMLDVLPGAVVTVDLADRTRMDGTYQVTSLHPAADPMGGEDGVALRMPFELAETSAAIYAWDAATEEEDVIAPDYGDVFVGTAPPGAITVISGSTVDLDTGGARVPRIRFAADPSPTASVTHYQWEYQNWSGENYGEWSPGGTIDADLRDGDDKVFGYLGGLTPWAATAIRLRAIGPAGISDWVTETGILLDFDVTINTSAAGPGRATFNITAPTNTVLAGVKIYRSDDSDFDNAVAVSELIAVASGVTLDITAGDATATDIVSNGGFDDASDWTTGANWSISGGVASHTSGATDDLQQLDTAMTEELVAGVTYRITLTIAGRTTGAVQPKLVGATVVYGTQLNADGTHTLEIVAPASPTALRFTANPGTFNGDLDDVRVVAATPACLEPGAGYFWIVPVATSGGEGPGAGPVSLHIP